MFSGGAGRTRGPLSRRLCRPAQGRVNMLRSAREWRRVDGAQAARFHQEGTERTPQQTRAKASDALEKAKACTALAQAKAAAPSLGAHVKTRRWPSLHLKLSLWPLSTFKEHAVSALTGISQSVD